MANVALAMLKRQLMDLMKDDESGFSVGLDDDDDFFKWRVVFEGPPGTLYEGGLFLCFVLKKRLANFGKL